MRSEVTTSVTMKSVTFWDVPPCCLGGHYKNFTPFKFTDSQCLDSRINFFIFIISANVFHVIRKFLIRTIYNPFKNKTISPNQKFHIADSFKLYLCGETNAYRILVEKYLGKKPPRKRWKNNIRTDISGLG